LFADEHINDPRAAKTSTHRNDSFGLRFDLADDARSSTVAVLFKAIESSCI
jgi:hypothetical protein